MAIKVTLRIDDDRWTKHPYNIGFDDEECNSQFGCTRLDSREECYRQIEKAKSAGYDISPEVEEYFF